MDHLDDTHGGHLGTKGPCDGQSEFTKHRRMCSPISTSVSAVPPDSFLPWSLQANRMRSQLHAGSNFNIPYLHRCVDVETLFSITFCYVGGYYLCKVIKRKYISWIPLKIKIRICVKALKIFLARIIFLTFLLRLICIY